MPKTANAMLAGTLHLPPHEPWVDARLNDWNADPFGDRNWRFQRHTLRWLMPLVYQAEAGESECATAWLNIVRSWSEANPVPAHHNEAWLDMAVGTRAISLTLGARIVPSSEYRWYVSLLEEHLNWLSNPNNLGRGNHALHMHQGLLVVASILKDHDGQNVAIERMVDQFVQSFDHEGMNDEESFGYHQLNMTWWTEAWQRAKLEAQPIPRDVEDRLTLASDVLARS